MPCPRRRTARKSAPNAAASASASCAPWTGSTPSSARSSRCTNVEGYTLEELEKVLETPLGTLKSRLHRARQRLRALLRWNLFPRERVKE